MVKFSSLAQTGALVLLAANAFATNYWMPFEGKIAPSKGQQVLVPNQYRVVTLDQATAFGFLAGLDMDAAQAKQITLPTPDGKGRTFKIWKTPVMEQPLQSSFPQIQTFTATALDNSHVTAKIDYTVNGFHAMVFDGNNTYFIDPFSNVADGYYTVYFKKDYTRTAEKSMTCQLDEEPLTDPSGVPPSSIDGSLPSVGLKQNGINRKTYRLALSCTGEYAVAVAGSSPTTAAVLSAMVTTMNRVNGIYEREVSATMVLIAANADIIYLNSGNDPFGNNFNGMAMLGENQNNINLVIGSANYDIGHVFSTGGGGIASLGSVCGTGQKARGVTGSPSPVGDPYDVDYVAHEMGHQFGGNHTFNNCGGNENSTTAYEPGSGSTIMAYAGICGQSNNLQSNSSPYFHNKSLDEITDFIVNGGFGNAGGNACGVNATGDQPPVLPSIEAAYTIPYQTPFELESPVAEITATDTLTYCWEQMDLGNLGNNENGSANFINGPSFRSFTPSASRLRVFPLIDSLVRNRTAYRGERLPAVARTLKFKASVRSVKDGWGTFDLADDLVTLTVINTGTPFKVTYPDAATNILYALATDTVTWDVSQTDVAPINADNVDIFLSLDGGFTYPFTLATGVPNNGSAAVTLPDTSSEKARIKVKGAGNVFFDISNFDFVITDTVGPILSVADVTLDNDLKVYPNPATDQLHIRYAGTGKLSAMLYNAVGQKMWNGYIDRERALPVGSYGKGFYYLQLINEEKGAKVVRRITLQ